MTRVAGGIARAAMVAAFAVPNACGAPPSPFTAAPWPEATRMFQNDPLFKGADGAYSVDLGNDRVLWLFGDSFIAPPPSHDASESYMVRNTVAIQTGYDPSRAFLRYYWGQSEGHPSSFVPEQGKYWMWPGHGIRVDGRLLLFYGRNYQSAPGMWGFEGNGWTAFVVENPDDEPGEWRMTEARTGPSDGSSDLGDAVLRDGDYLYVYGRTHDTWKHHIHLARFSVTRAMDGDLTGAEWWSPSGWGPVEARASLLDWGVEYSVHFDEHLGCYILIETSGIGPTTLAYRTAPAPWGPWSEREDLLRPPESFRPGAFVYAGKGHPELQGGDLIVTYVPSTFDPVPAEIGDVLYFPYFARLTYR